MMGLQSDPLTDTLGAELAQSIAHATVPYSFELRWRVSRELWHLCAMVILTRNRVPQNKEMKPTSHGLVGGSRPIQCYPP
jgi:hypothetical protein